MKIPRLRYVGLFTLAFGAVFLGLMFWVNTWAASLGFSIVVSLATAALFISGGVTAIFGWLAYRFRWHNFFAESFKVICGAACVLSIFYALLLGVPSLHYALFAPTAEIVLPDHFKSKFAVFIEKEKPYGLTTFKQRHYVYTIPESGEVRVQEGWWGSTYKYGKDKAMQSGPGLTVLRYRNGTTLRHGEYHCDIYPVFDNKDIVLKYGGVLKKDGKSVNVGDARPTIGQVCIVGSKEEISVYDQYRSPRKDLTWP